MNKSTNFPAYPFPGFHGGGGLVAQPSNTGMSFRDLIAIKVLGVLVQSEQNEEELCRYAYRIADHMIKARGGSRN